MASRHLQPVLSYVRNLSARGALGRLSDLDLLDRFAIHQDDDAFAVLVERYAGLVFGVCRRRLHDEHDAEDACQATFLVLARKAADIRKREMLGSWLHGVAYRVAEQLRRDIARRRGRECPAVDVPGPDSTVEITWRELRAVLDEELDRLPARLRAPLVLCYLQGQTRDEAAQHLGWTEGTLRGRLQRGRQLLRVRLSRRGVTLPAALLAASLLGVRDAGAAPALFVVRALKTMAAAGGSAPLAAVPERVVTLTEGVLKTMWILKAKTVTAVVVAVLMLGAGTGTWTYRTLAGPPDAGTQSSAPPPGIADIPTAHPERPDTATPARIVGALKQAGNPAVLTVRFSPDGKQLAAGYADGTVVLWDVATRKRVASFPEQQTRSMRLAAIQALAFAPDGRTVAAGGRGSSVMLWDARTGRADRLLPAQGTGVTSLAFSPDGKQLAVGSAPAEFRLWALASGEPHSPLEKGGTGSSVAFAPDGQRLATASPDGTVVLWHVGNGKIFWRTCRNAGRHDSGTYKPTPLGRANSVAFSPDGKLLAVAGPGGEVRLLDAATGKEVRVLTTGQKSAVSSVAFAPDGHVLATTGKNAIRLWDAATGKEVARLTDSGLVDSLTFAPSGELLASAGRDGTVRLWQVQNGQVVQREGHVARVARSDRLTQLVHELSRSTRTPEQQIEALYLAVLGRFPTETEQDFTRAQLAHASDRARALQEVLGLLTRTREFSSHVQSLAQRAMLQPAGPTKP